MNKEELRGSDYDAEEFSGVEVFVDGDFVEVGERINKDGTEGVIYELKDRSNSFVKIYRSEYREDKQSKIQQMIEHPLGEKLYEGDSPSLIAWPKEIVSKFDIVIGFEMPRIDTNLNAREFARQELDWEPSNQRVVDRYQPAINMAHNVWRLRKHGFAIGDMNEKNFFVDENNKVYFLDCDSYSIERTRFTGNMEAPRYNSPEGLGNNHQSVVETQQFGLAIYMFQFLMNGFHPYQAKNQSGGDSLEDWIRDGYYPYVDDSPPDVQPLEQAPPYKELPAVVQSAFNHSFTIGRANPGKRLTAKDWKNILSFHEKIPIVGSLNEISVGLPVFDTAKVNIGNDSNSDPSPEPDKQWWKDTETDTVTFGGPPRPDEPWWKEIEEENIDELTTTETNLSTDRTDKAGTETFAPNTDPSIDQDLSSTIDKEDLDDSSEEAWFEDIEGEPGESSDETQPGPIGKSNTNTSSNQSTDSIFTVLGNVHTTMLALFILALFIGFYHTFELIPTLIISSPIAIIYILLVVDA